jgi:hypothetical protein
MTTDGGGWTYVGTNPNADKINTFKYFPKETIIIKGRNNETIHNIGDDYFEIGSTVDSEKKVVYFELNTLFNFNEIKGTWASKGIAPVHNDDNSSYNTWGNVPSSWNGYVQFGTPDKIIKRGGEWGGDYNNKTTDTVWSNTVVNTGEQNIIRWSVADQSTEEYSYFYKINLWVR